MFMLEGLSDMFGWASGFSYIVRFYDRGKAIQVA